jgi:hypothetical protein
MRIRTSLLAIVFCFTFTYIYCQEATDVKKKFTDDNAKVITEEKTEDVRATIRIPDTSAFMGRKKTEISDDYRNFLIQKLIKSNKMLYNKTMEE